jgi:GTP pyrophosphokinase
VDFVPGAVEAGIVPPPAPPPRRSITDDLSELFAAGGGGGHKLAEIVEESPVLEEEVIVEGVEDLMTHMGRCCKPVPYDPIVGFVTRGRGVTVHRRDCANLRAMDEDERARLVEVRWSEQQSQTAYAVDILVIASDRKGLLRDISGVLTNDDIDVIGVNTNSDRRTDTATMRFTVEVCNMEQLSRLLSKIEQLPDVNVVKRIS